MPIVQQPYNGNNWWDNTSIAPIDPAAMAVPQMNLGGAGTPSFSATQDPSIWSGISNWMDSSGFLGKKLGDGTQIQGWGMPALSAASGLTNAFFGAKQYNLAKDTLDQNKKQFQLNFDAQKKTTNSALADRQASRVAANPGAYQSVGDYMKQYGI